MGTVIRGRERSSSARNPAPRYTERDRSDSSLQSELEREVSRRRTFAIISHPDAGKTTLTEKLLLYAGAIELAGAVRGRKARKHATSDWMALEQERGISITSAALEFELEGRRMALLDTPGHKDFSEDTYRALIAADSVVMVIDAANGVEEQTRKLFEVCRRHRLPILTFVNKFDRPARDPLELLDDIESTLGIAAAPVNWPVGNAEQFRGVYDIAAQAPAALRARDAGAVSRAGRRLGSRRSAGEGADRREHLRALPRVARRHPRRRHDVRHRRLPRRHADAGVLRQRDDQLRPRAVPAHAGRARAAPARRGRATPASSSRPTIGSPASSSRSRRTWIRAIAIASRSSASAPAGSRRTWSVSNSRAGKALRASRAYRFFGRDRETITEAYAGDILGLVNPGQFAIGDTLHTGAPLQFLDIPRFPPEHFGAAAAAGHALQAVRRRAAAARGRRADAGVLRRRAAAASRSSASSARCSST